MAKPSSGALRNLQVNRILSESVSQNGIFSYIFSRHHTSCSPSNQNSLRHHSSSIFPSGFSNPRNLTSEIHSKLCFHEISFKPTSPNFPFSSNLTQKQHLPTPFVGNSKLNGALSSGFSNSRRLSPQISPKISALSSRGLGFRYISFKSSDTSKLNGNFTKTLVNKPLSAARSALARYREAVGLQIEAFWKRNYLVLVGAVGVGVCIVLWRIMFGIANTFVGFSEGMAKYGFLGLSSAIVTFAGLYVRSRFTINPDRAYRIAMRKLNTSAGILEIMGAPLSGTDLRAYVMSGGGLRLKNFKLKLGGKRCFLIFPVRGSERKGLVSVEVKKKKGQYDMKLLAVDIPMTAGPDQRFFLIGDEEEYKVGGGLISELRDPIVKAMAAEKEFEVLDQKEDEEDAERELKEAERKDLEEIEKLEKGSP